MKAFTYDLVKFALEKYPETRNDDKLLIALVISAYGETDILKIACRKDIPSFETVTRCRRSIQRDYPELRAEKEVEIARTNKQKEFIDFNNYGLME